MGRYDNTKRNQYNSTPRKVFDVYIDRMATKRARDKEDHRADIAALLRRLQNIELALTELTLEHGELQDHIDRHCAQLDTSREADPRDS